MSAFRKTVLTTAIIGAGLASTSGAAFASEHHDGGHEKASSGCSNLVKADNSNGTGKVTLGGVLGGSQNVSPSNVCDNFSGNSFLNGNNLAGGDITNGDTESVSINKAESTSIVKTITASIL
ncbi:hypothetical protein [Actinomycetospora termitidis]|uniref:Secreted protein n=1 Tax=Actinomycetospora termitidis TaxID=3053470 RepID=A0ABT7M4I1_9PSEU|nr:hypothetical protein [Actinomycetospora sp. Odt1-22]MDL5155581.1 hypothetical protein [Actinomycetospora sp. Odt1-22]